MIAKLERVHSTRSQNKDRNTKPPHSGNNKTIDITGLTLPLAIVAICN